MNTSHYYIWILLVLSFPILATAGQDHVALARTAVAEGDPYLAIRHLHQIDAQHRDAQTTLVLGRCYLRIGYLAQAEGLAASVIASDARNVDALLLLGDVEMRRGHWGVAVKKFALATVTGDAPPTAWLSLSQALQHDGKTDEAERAFGTFMRLSSK